MVNPNLPQDILIDIFSRLPEKSIGQCRSLSKQWFTLLCTPQFIKYHLTRRPRQENLFVITQFGSINSITSIKENAYCTKLELPYKFCSVVGSCDGLVLLAMRGWKMVLVNPITLQLVEIPDLPRPRKRKGKGKGKENFRMLGFGYGKFSDDYNVVQLSGPIALNASKVTYRQVFVDLYSVKMGVWKRSYSSPCRHAFIESSIGTFVNGAIHWIGQGLLIAAFSLADEVFTGIPVPSAVELNLYYELAILGGCLCMMDSSIRHTDVWVMKEYGIQESWTKFTIYDYWYIKPLCYIGGDEVVLLIENKSLKGYNLENRKWRDIIVDGVSSMFMDGDTSIESSEGVYNPREANAMDLFVGSLVGSHVGRLPTRFVDGCSFVGSLVSPCYI